MFIEESEWIKSVLKKIKPYPSNNKVGNLGSSSEEFRKVYQPHIQKNIIEVLENDGWNVIHIDFKNDNGVDIVGDLTQENFGNNLKNEYALTICTNMLEHVLDIPLVVNNLMKITAEGGYILLTVPYKYKIHYDPIDNGFRPTPDEIIQLFTPQKIEVIDKTIISIKDKSYYREKKSKFPLWGKREIFAYQLGIYFKVSGVLLKKI
ncbi:MAG: hypothetical protein AMXMBFR79_08330 [Chitinophagaceae bacterium]